MLSEKTFLSLRELTTAKGTKNPSNGYKISHVFFQLFASYLFSTTSIELSPFFLK
jgi:hypothetical protein